MTKLRQGGKISLELLSRLILGKKTRNEMEDTTLARELIRSLDKDFPNHNSRKMTY